MQADRGVRRAAARARIAWFLAQETPFEQPRNQEMHATAANRAKSLTCHSWPAVIGAHLQHREAWPHGVLGNGHKIGHAESRRPLSGEIQIKLALKYPLRKVPQTQ